MAKKMKGGGDSMVGGTSDMESKPWGHGNFANMPQDVKLWLHNKYRMKATN